MNFVEIYLEKRGRNELCGEPKSCIALVKFVQLNWALGHNVLYSDKFHSSKCLDLRLYLPEMVVT